MSQQSLAELKEEIHHFFENYTQTHQQLSALEMSLDPQIKRYRDLKNSIDTAHHDGRIEGIEEGIEIGKEISRLERIKEGKEIGKQEIALEIARNMLAQGLDIALVAQVTGLSVEQIEGLRH